MQELTAYAGDGDPYRKLVQWLLNQNDRLSEMAANLTTERIRLEEQLLSLQEELERQRTELKQLRAGLADGTSETPLDSLTPRQSV
jgi:predicted  nucleic acid-binding Zn-ribbon protein